MPFKLRVLQDGKAVHALAVRKRPITAGRAPTNDLVLNNGKVSWQHMRIWVEEGLAWIRDLGSSNGTFVNEGRVTGKIQLKPGDLIRVGTEVTMRLDVDEESGLRQVGVRAFMLEDAESGLRFPIRRERFHIGTGEGVQLPLDSGPERAATLIVHLNGEVWLGRDDGEDAPLELEEIFEVGERKLRVVQVDATHAPTVTAHGDLYGYKLEVMLDGPTGPEAVVTDTSTGRVHRVEADNRAVLLYVLGRQVLEDIDKSVPITDRGWCTDDQVVLGVWGRGRVSKDTGALHVLVYRLRHELKAAGFDPWCIEKRRRCIRIRAGTVRLR